MFSFWQDGLIPETRDENDPVRKMMLKAQKAAKKRAEKIRYNREYLDGLAKDRDERERLEKEAKLKAENDILT